MIKMLFLDYRDHEIVDGFTRKLVPPRKFEGNPILVSDHPVEGNYMCMYGSVVQRPDDGLWQMWYTVSGRTNRAEIALAYAESQDGIEWRRPSLDIVQVNGEPTHLLFQNRPHGAAVFYDAAETNPRRRYKMLSAVEPSNRICLFQSADGIHWMDGAENPVIGINPDCPMSFHRAADGRYVFYGRPGFADRRIARRESWDLVHWSEPKIVIDQEPGDHPQTQFYGLGAVRYGAYEIGTLWIYHTERTDMGFQKMEGHQQPEFVYARSGYAWHRAELGTGWIALGEPGSWEWGNIQPASHPVLLKDEIRFYYVGMRTGHGVKSYEGAEPRCGIGFATMKPDRFVGITAGAEGHILTRAFWTKAPYFFVNATVPAGGEVRVEIDDIEGNPIHGFEMAKSIPIEGDALHHRLAWQGNPDPSVLVGREVRMRVQARNATIYALVAGDESELARYWEFEIPSYLSMDRTKARAWLDKD